MTLEQYDACGTLRSARQYLKSKSFVGDGGRYDGSGSSWQWTKCMSVAIALIDECISRIQLEAK